MHSTLRYCALRLELPSNLIEIQNPILNITFTQNLSDNFPVSG